VGKNAVPGIDGHTRDRVAHIAGERRRIMTLIFTAGAVAFAYLIIFGIGEIVRHGKIMKDSEGD
jgi:hypothetical protein